jgi:Cu+-exporting ATPase
MSCCDSSRSEKDFAAVPAADDKQNRDATDNKNASASVGSRCRCSCNTSRKGVMPVTAKQATSGAVQHSCQCLQCSCDEFCPCQASEIIALFDSIVAPQPLAISASVHDGVSSGQERKPNVDDEEHHFTPTQSPSTISASPSASASASATKIQSGIKSIQVSIMGMTCTMCKKTITNALKAVAGVVSVQINSSTDSGIIAYNSTILRGREGIQKILETIEGAGYDVQLEVSHGMTDSNTSHVCDEEEAEQQQDIHTTDFSTMLDLTTPLLPPGECNEVAADRSRHQYRNRLEQREARQAKDLARRKHAFLTSLVGTVPIFLISMVLMHIPLPIIQSILRHPIIPGLTLDALLLWILCTPVQFGSGWVFYKNSYHNIRNRALGMDVLIAIGITASYSYAVILIVLSIVTGNDSHGAEFFETSAVLISFVLLGRWLQLLAVRRTSDALTKLMNLAVKRATLVIPRSKIGRDQRGDELFCPEHDAFDEMEVDVEDLKRNDYVKILPGSGIPADGVIIYGDITVNESMITGESMPVYKESRDYVIGGSVCEEGVAFVKLR